MPAAALLLAAALPAATMPSANPVVIDGRIADGEWDGATRHVLADGTEILLQHDGSDLHVAIRARNDVIGSVCLRRGDTIEVLHASMALGRATYRRDGARWSLAEGFSYGMREADFSPATLERRRRYLEAHGWLANTTPMGDANVREYRISGAAEAGATIAVAYLLSGGETTPAMWPSTRPDGCAAVELVRGDTPPSVPFEPQAWLPLQAPLDDR